MSRSEIASASVSRRSLVRIFATAAIVAPTLGTLGSFGPLGLRRVAAQGEGQPLKIGALFPFTGDLSDFGGWFWDSAVLAIEEINAAGGVFGRPIELVRGDTATSPQQAVEEARRLVEIEGIAALIGAAGSGETLPVVESISGPEGILTISPSATSPALTVAADDDFFFRTTLSDAAQGTVLADLAWTQGHASAGVLYINNAYGVGLSQAFAARFAALGGSITAMIPHEQEQASYVSELSAALEGDPAVFVPISYPESAGVFLREALESGEVPAMIFSEGLKSEALLAELGWEHFAGVLGTTPGSTESEAGAAFDAAFAARYGDLPAAPYLREVYDAAYLIALAAQAAGTSDSAAIRDALRLVANEPGEAVQPGVEGWRAAVAALDAGAEVDYQGAAGAADFDERGDVVKGSILIWQVQGEAIATIESRPIDLSPSDEEQV
jgi:ABC-type branched-subunit amino acid transport system substrate-binding protein